MVNPNCCGQPSQWTVQSISLAYWFCKVCKQEPKAPVSAMATTRMVNYVQDPNGVITARVGAAPFGHQQSPNSHQISLDMANKGLDLINKAETDFRMKWGRKPELIYLTRDADTLLRPAFGGGMAAQIFGVPVKTASSISGCRAALTCVGVPDTIVDLISALSVQPLQSLNTAHTMTTKGTHMAWSVTRDMCYDCGCNGAQYAMNNWSCQGYKQYAQQQSAQAAQQAQQLTKGIP